MCVLLSSLISHAAYSEQDTATIHESDLSFFYSTQKVTITTGSSAALYFATGRHLCAIIKKHSPMECEASISKGVVNNLKLLMKTKMNMGFVPSSLYHAFEHKLPPFGDVRPKDEMKVLFSLHSQIVTFFTRTDTGITIFDDRLKKHPIDAAHPDTSIRFVMNQVWDEMGWNVKDFPLVKELYALKRPRELCAKRIDFYPFIVTHPNQTTEKAFQRCSIRLVPLPETLIQKMITKYPYYIAASIPSRLYKDVQVDIPSFGDKVLIVVRADMNEQFAYGITQTILDNLEMFKQLDPVHQQLTQQSMALEGLKPSQLHPGALRYYREQDLYPTEEKAP